MAIIDNDIDKEPKWYALRVFSGYENVAKRNLENTVDKFDLQDRIFKVVIPMEDVLVEKRGKKTLVPKKTMPGYILVNMKYGNDIWHAVIHTMYVTSFVGPAGRPICMTDDEVRRLGLTGDANQDVKVELNVKVGDTIEILEGSLASFVGVVKEVDAENQKVTATVEMFNRESEVSLNFSQIRVKR